MSSGWRTSAAADDGDEQVGHRQVHVRIELAPAGEQQARLRHVRRDHELEDGDLPRLREPTGDRLADARQLLDAVGRGSLAGRRRRERAPTRARPRGADGAAASRSTSSATIRPSGPVPLIDARSRPRSRARRRASGDAFRRSPGSRSGVCESGDGGAAATGGSGAAAFCPAPRPAADAGSADSSSTASPGSPMNASVVPTGTSPSETAILRSVPPTSASTSCVTFSVSSSYEQLALLDRCRLLPSAT